MQAYSAKLKELYAANMETKLTDWVKERYKDVSRGPHVLDTRIALHGKLLFVPLSERRKQFIRFNFCSFVFATVQVVSRFTSPFVWDSTR